jgi:hypothetical protein
MEPLIKRLPGCNTITIQQKILNPVKGGKVRVLFDRDKKKQNKFALHQNIKKCLSERVKKNFLMTMTPRKNLQLREMLF